MFDVAHNQVSVIKDTASVSNRTRLLILTEPTELYNNLDFGVGLKRYIWTYNSKNQKAIIQDRIAAQIKKYEPCVDPESIVFSDGLLATGSEDSISMTHDYNRLKMTVSLSTIFGDKTTVDLNDLTDALYNLPYDINTNDSINYIGGIN